MSDAAKETCSQCGQTLENIVTQDRDCFNCDNCVKGLSCSENPFICGDERKLWKEERKRI